MIHQLKITIAGTVGSGKTTVCQLISKTLSEKGFNNFIIVGEDENDDAAVERSYEKRLQRFVRNGNKNRIFIQIETKQVHREALEE